MYLCTGCNYWGLMLNPERAEELYGVYLLREMKGKHINPSVSTPRWLSGFRSTESLALLADASQGKCRLLWHAKLWHQRSPRLCHVALA